MMPGMLLAVNSDHKKAEKWLQLGLSTLPSCLPYSALLCVPRPQAVGKVELNNI